MEPHSIHPVERTGKPPAPLCQLLSLHQAIKYDFGVTNNQGPPKRHPGQKNMCTKGREHMLMPSAKPMNMHVKYSIQTGAFSVLSRHDISEEISPHASIQTKNIGKGSVPRLGENQTGNLNLGLQTIKPMTLNDDEELP